MKSKKIKVAIEGTKFVSEVGVGYMVANLCGTLVPSEAKLIMKGCAFIGTLGIQGAVSNKANEYWDELGNAIEGSIEAAKALINEKKEKVEEPKEEKPKKKETKKKSKKSSKKKTEPIEVEFEGIEEDSDEA